MYRFIHTRSSVLRISHDLAWLEIGDPAGIYHPLLFVDTSEDPFYKTHTAARPDPNMWSGSHPMMMSLMFTEGPGEPDAELIGQGLASLEPNVGNDDFSL